MRDYTAVIEKLYKLPDVNNNREPQKLYWHKGIKMSSACASELLKFDKDAFDALAEVHGCQTANMIERGEIGASDAVVAKTNLLALSRETGLSWGCLNRRYKKGLRGADLIAPIPPKMRRR